MDGARLLLSTIFRCCQRETTAWPSRGTSISGFFSLSLPSFQMGEGGYLPGPYLSTRFPPVFVLNNGGGVFPKIRGLGEEKRKVRGRAPSRLLFVYPCFRARKHRFRLLAPETNLIFIRSYSCLLLLSHPKENRRGKNKETDARPTAESSERRDEARYPRGVT